MISGLSHITMIVNDLERTSILFEQVFDAYEVFTGDEQCFSLSSGKFFLIGSAWICIMQGKHSMERSFNHIAFKIRDADFDDYVFRVESLHLDMECPKPCFEGKGKSLYFYDYDNHLFELHTGTLSERLPNYDQANSY